MDAQQGYEVCDQHTVVIRSNDEWKSVIRAMQYDGNVYTTRSVGDALTLLAAAEQDHGLFALLGASS